MESPKLLEKIATAEELVTIQDPDFETIDGNYIMVPIPSFNKMCVIAPLAVSKKLPVKVKVAEVVDIAIEPIKGCAIYKHGKGIYKCSTSKSVYDGEWAYDRAHGIGSITYQDGKTMYNGLWANNEIIGPGTYTWADGSSYTGNWTNQLPSGNGVFNHGKDIVQWRGDFIDGKANGLRYEIL